MPFSNEHSSLRLEDSSILEATGFVSAFQGKSIRMMGVFENEIEEVSQIGTKAGLRIAGFDEEEKRLRGRMSYRSHTKLKLPQGNYIFCDFRTLEIPGIQLNPPASKALKRMHRLAADPGIVAIMNKHRWRVGIMTELAPVGYVGISPKCLLGFNKNQGEEISLRLRTDDLKGFRKYESIKKTLLHELAHMLQSDHDANFYALDKQLNEEAASLDWTRSRSNTLNGRGSLEYYENIEDDYDGSSNSISHKLGGETSEQLSSARASSIAAAYRRLANVSANSLGGSEVREEPDPDDSEIEGHGHSNFEDQRTLELDYNDSRGETAMEIEHTSSTNGKGITCEPDPDDCAGVANYGPQLRNSERIDSMTSDVVLKNEVVAEPDPDDSMAVESEDNEFHLTKVWQESSPGEFEIKSPTLACKNTMEPDPDDSEAIGSGVDTITSSEKPDPDDSLGNEVDRDEADTSGKDGGKHATSTTSADEPDPDDGALQRIQDPVAVVCNRLQKAIDMLRYEVGSEAASVQTFFKIIKNVIEHPDELKFRRLRKGNPLFQKNVANYKAAMEVLFLVGFNEDTVPDEIGRVETYVVLKRNDPGLLWLVKSSLEMCIAH
ncbi:hypothetical protein C5167_039109 [Papaver somniferum]|uniref:WLM domain-containing protein n=1 Tax=Papaver somniferum TaxID=3469 RepID=A0A4Y7IDP1_PAPSO|nr:hypothetical protein C5167_039109 [Papaver somniferum]